MIRQDFEWRCTRFEILLPPANGGNDGEELLFVDGVVDFGGSHFAGEEGDGVLVGGIVVGVGLGKDGCDSVS